MIPVSTLYDEYIDRRKLTEQKNPFEEIVPPPSRGVGTTMSEGRRVIVRRKWLEQQGKCNSTLFKLSWLTLKS